jgi:hypothetical protein
MDHNLQHQYLQTLGIMQYVPRDTVYADVVVEADNTSANAKIGARALSNGAMQAPPIGQFENSAKATKNPIDIAALVNLDLDSKPAPVKSKVAVSRPPVVEDTQPATSIEVKFSLWQASEELLVCSAVEGALADTSEMQLLTNILNAIGCGITRLPQMELVEWPPYPNASGDETEVREFLKTLIDARLANKPVKSVLLLGDSAANWLLGPDLDQQKSSGRVAFSEQTVALLLPSLGSMIAEPQNKARAWQLLQSLLPQTS